MFYYYVQYKQNIHKYQVRNAYRKHFINQVVYNSNQISTSPFKNHIKGHFISREHVGKYRKCVVCLCDVLYYLSPVV